MSDARDRDIDLYLAGELPLDRAVELDERLSQPELGGELSRELLVREFLHTMGPDAAPAELVEYVQASVATDVVATTAPRKRRSLWAKLKTARWLMRTPVSAVRAPFAAAHLVRGSANSIRKGNATVRLARRAVRWVL